MINDPDRAHDIRKSLERILGDYAATVDLPPEGTIVIRPSVCTEKGVFVYDDTEYSFSNTEEFAQQVREVARNNFNLVNLSICKGDTGYYLQSR